MVNKYVDNLSERLKFNYYSVVNKCERMGKYFASYWDVVCYLNDYMCNLPDDVDNDYFLAICELEEYYHKLWKMELN